MKANGRLKKNLSIILSVALVCSTLPMDAFASSKSKDNVISENSAEKNHDSIKNNEETIKSDSFQINFVEDEESIDAEQDSGDSFSVDGFSYKVNSDNVSVTLTEYDNNSVSTLTLPGTVTYDGFNYKVTEIGEDTFENYQNLVTVYFPTELRIIGNYAFHNCTRLNDVSLPDSVTKIGKYAFDGCLSIESIRLSKKLEIMRGGAFKDCDAITEVEIPKSLYNGGNKEDYYNDCYGAFCGCDGLKTVTFENGTEWVADFLFYECTGLEEIELPDSMTIVGESSFSRCANLEKITFGKNITEIKQNAFYNCKKLDNIVLPEKLQTIGNWSFQDCSNIKSITLPDSVTKLGKYAFENCTSINYLKLSKKLEIMRGGAFKDCDAITEVEIPKSLYNGGNKEDYYDDCYGAFNSCDGLKKVTFETGTEWVADYLFDHCTGIEEIVLPESITIIGKSAFSEATSLKHISFGSSVDEIKDYAFNHCISMKSVDLPNTVRSIGKSAFENCSELTYVKLSEKVNDIGSNAFKGCDELCLACNYYSDGVIYSIDNDLRFVSSGESFIDNASKMMDRSASLFSANTDAINANGTLPFTIKWNAKKKWKGELEDQTIVSFIPRYTDLNEETIKVNGKEIDDYTYDERNRKLSIPVDEDSATITYSVTLRDKERIVCYAYVSAYKEEGKTREVIGTIDEDFSGISLSLPEVTDSKTFNVSGITTPSTKVDIYVNGKAVTSAMSKKTGTYESSVELDNPKDRYPYLIEARGVDDYGNTISATRETTYEAAAPKLKSFVLDYSEGTENKEIDLINTNGTKPLVYYTPECRFVFKADFENMEKLDKVYVTSTKGTDKKVIEAKYNSSSGKYITDSYFDENDPGYVPGVIGVEFTRKYEEAKVTTDYDFDEVSTILGDTLQKLSVDYKKKTDEEVQATIDFSSVLTGISDASIDATVSYVDMKTGSSIGDILDEMGYTKNAYSYILPGIDDSRCILTAEKKNVGYWLTLVNDGVQTRNKIASIKLDMTDEWAKEFDKVFNTAEKWNNISIGANVIYNSYGIIKDHGQLLEEINKSKTIKDKEEARRKADELEVDQFSFMLAMTVIPLLVAGTGGAIMPAASMIFSGLIAAMQATSGLFYDMRIAQIKGEKFRLNWVIDPSGYVYDASDNSRIANATVTAYWIPYDGTDQFWNSKPSFTNYGTKWDASEYEQENSLHTNGDGKYAWNVPEGWWRVKCEKAGYESEWTDWMSVPPVQTDVNIGMYQTGKKPAQQQGVNGSSTNTTVNTGNNPGLGGNTPVSPTSVKAPKKTTLSSVKNSKKKSITVKWKKNTDNTVKGYEVQYALDKRFKKKAKTKTVKSAKKTSLTVKKLKKGKTYFVRIRAYALDGGKKVYGKWSKTKKIKIKK